MLVQAEACAASHEQTVEEVLNSASRKLYSTRYESTGGTYMQRKLAQLQHETLQSFGG